MTYARPLGRILHTRLIKYPPISPQECFVPAILKPGKLSILRPRSELCRHPAGVLQVSFIGTQVWRSRFPLKNLQQLRSFPSTSLHHCLTYGDAYHDEKEEQNKTQLRIAEPFHATQN